MKQPIYGLGIYLFLMLPPVVTLLESIMVVHMHMQMPLLVMVGMLFTPFLQQTFPAFFEKWNENGVPGIVLFMIIISYWMIPRTMDEALTVSAAEIFKFISLPFLAGVPLRDSWSKLTIKGKNSIFILLSILFGIMAWIYILSPNQICNSYLIKEQKALGWTFLLTGLCIVIYFIQMLFIDKEEYGET
ncbi:hypothetical protein [Oceanobacillus profundus]|uniref:hypothetical protein n=1 Tax=Oceanobacillus TaxID=182709 RepID=UPI0026E2041B|nr:hypothetical protein [Oceanobacillus profundus]MDO6451422.1 hypothetical protein [Oceanobacillus profundus]